MIRAEWQTIGWACGFMVMGALAATALWNGVATAEAQEQPAAGTLRHVVMFKFKDDATKEQVQEIVTAFGALPKKIEGITAYEWGTNNSPEGLADGFTHCFVVTFKDAKAREAYLPHPAHQEFVTLLKPRLEKVFVVDYFAQK